MYTGQKINKKNTNQLQQYYQKSMHVKPPQNLNLYKLRKLPFYENIEEIIKLTLLNSSNDKCTLVNHLTGSNIFYDHSFFELIIFIISILFQV